MIFNKKEFPPVLPSGQWKIEFRFFGKMNGQVVPAFTLIVVFEIKAQDARDVF